MNRPPKRAMLAAASGRSIIVDRIGPLDVGDNVSGHGFILCRGARLAAMATIPTCCAFVRNTGLRKMASFGYASNAYYDAAMPDPATVPAAYEGVLLRRVLAYFVDLCVIGALAILYWLIFGLLWLLTLGLLGPVLWFLFGLIPLAYHTLLLSGPRSATVGMRLFDIELRSVTGERPSFMQALIQTALFYISVSATCSLILLFALANRQKRTLHDVLAGTVMVRSFPLS